MAKSPKSEGPSFETGMLAFARSLQISEGVFCGVTASGTVPVEVLEKGVRGQSSEDRAKNPGLSNPQTVEFAVLPQGCTAVQLAFSIRILPNALKPHACGNGEVSRLYEDLAASYARAGGFRTLAELYIWNIANARFAWRNRFQVDASVVKVAFNGEEIVFDPSTLSLETPATQDEMALALASGDAYGLGRLIDAVTAGLSTKVVSLDVVWEAEMAPGQEIFPSQEYMRDAKKDEQLSRVYAKLPIFWHGREVAQASMHSQKIGAALRHIDVWHGSHSYGAIAVNPYGGVQETADVLRKAKNSFYDVRKHAQAVLDKISAAEAGAELPGDIHFLMANLVRGGVFGSSSKTAEAQG